MTRRPLPASRAERGMVLLVALLCTLVVAASAGTALWLRTSADELASRLFAEAPYPSTQVQVAYDDVTDRQVPADGGEEIARAVAPALRETLAAPRSAVVTTEMVPEILPPRPGQPSYLSVAGLPDAESLVEVVRGRMPRPGSAPQELPSEVAAAYEGRPPVPVVEVVLEVAASRELEMPVGSWVELGSPTYQGIFAPPAVLHVVGTFRPSGPYPTALDDVDTLREPSVSILPELNLVRGTALAADQATVMEARWTDLPQVRWTFDPVGAPSADQAEVLVEEGRQVELQDWPPVLDAGGIGAATDIGDLATEVVDQRRTSDGLVALALTALAAGALTVLLAAALVLAGRRAPVTTVVRARGASGPWLAARRGGEALLLVLPGVAAGLLLVGLTAGAPTTADLFVVLAAAAACALVVTAAQVVPRGGSGGALHVVLGDALQLVAVALAVAVSVLVLLDSSLSPDDPLLLVLPPLLGAAAAVVIVRMLQVGLGGLRRAARRTRTVTPVVALSQSVAVARKVVVTITAVVLAVSSVVLALAAADTLRRGADRAGWEQVGADLSVTAGGLDDDVVERLAALPGVTAVAPVFTADSVSLDTRTGVEGVRVVAVDPEALAAVSQGPVADVDLGADGEALAVATSPDLVLDDDRGLLRYAQSLVDVRVVDQLDRVPGVTDGGSFVLVDLAQLEAATDRQLQGYGTVLLAGDPARDEVEAIVREADPQAIVTTRAGVTRDRLEGPAVARTLATLTVASLAAIALAVFAVLLTVGLGAPERRRTAAVLATVGADTRQAARVGVVALLPIVVAAGLAAAGCGLLLTAVAGNGFDLAGLTGTTSTLPVRLDPPTALGLLAGLAGLVVLAAAASRTRTARTPGVPDPPDRESR